MIDQYVSKANELVKRIILLIETEPKVLELDEPWDLFKLGLKCEDLEPTLFQASWALRKAQQIYKESHAN